MMKNRNLFLVPGLLALALCGPALAHDPDHRAAYTGDAWSGSATIWGNSRGYAGWSGSLNLGAVYSYPQGYILVTPPLPGHRHVASCHHAAPPRYAHGYRRGYKHGHGHFRGHGKRYPGHH
jgi:hypothetical protein